MRSSKQACFIYFSPSNRINGDSFFSIKRAIKCFVAIIFLIHLTIPSLAVNKLPSLYSSFKDSSKSVYMAAVPSKNKVFVGEAFSIKYLLYYSTPVIDPQNQLEFSFKDAYQEEFPDQDQTTSKLINGKLFHVILIKKLLLIPKDTGTFNIPSISMKLKISVPPDAGDFFQEDKTVTIKVSSSPTSINVLPVPPKKDSIDFSGAVGNFVIKVDFLKSKKSSNMLNVSLIATGIGDLKFAKFQLPRLQQGIDVFNENNTETHQLVDDGINVKHTYSFNLVANYRGNYTIGPITFLFFNPQTSSYVKFISETYKWRIDTGPAMPGNIAGININSKQKDAGLLFIKTTLNKPDKKTLFFGSIYCYLLLLFSCLLFLTGLAYSYILKDKQINKAFYSYKTAGRQASKSIGKLELLSPDIDMDVFSKTLVHIFQKYLFERNFMQHNDFSIHDIAVSLKSHQVPESIGQQVFDFVNRQHTIRFSVVDSEQINKAEYCLTLLKIIENLDGYAKG